MMSQKFLALADQLKNFSTPEDIAPTIRQLGRLITDPKLTSQILSLLKPYLSHDDPKVRRYAVQALEKSADLSLEADFLSLWQKETKVDVQKVLLEALGKVGGKKSEALFSTCNFTAGILKQTFDKARLILTRNLERSQASMIDPKPNAPKPYKVLIHCRKGLEKFTAMDFGPEWQAKTRGPGRIEVTLKNNLDSMFISRTMLRFGFPLGEFSGDDPAATIANALTSESALAIFRTWTKGKIRFRLAISKKGHQRALIWKVAKLIALKATDLINDPTQALWEVQVTEIKPQRFSLELFPKSIKDPRFCYRLKDVPAASHPTIAAALVKIGGVEANDIVFDPFVGSGGELIERALAGPYLHLYGTDIDPNAIEAARANSQAAQIKNLTLVHNSFSSFSVPAPTLILSNPPMGRRVESQNAEELVLSFVRHSANILAAKGRLVFASPFPPKTIAAAKEAGLIHVFSQVFDMGGFSAAIQSFRKP